ncbi:MAG: hypothetical protein EZS28_020444 [Streblomastix strix]|uniref:Uncharacterized protein n=1 Tax=Streblomastix strix TaxID=222440 RepID=A0A5J4VP09_9EUKA|nr:MAG: hypothetical protein EZS28_020444 [Streblomastix strix]
MDKVHFRNIDTDSMYLAIAGSQIEGYKQGLKYMIKNQEFYDNHYKEWLPLNDCTVTQEKKLMGIITETQGENIIRLAPKCYNPYNGNEQNNNLISLVNKMKGVSEKKANLTTNDYIKCLNEGCNINVTTNNFQMKIGEMSMINEIVTGSGDYEVLQIQSFDWEKMVTIIMAELCINPEVSLYGALTGTFALTDAKARRNIYDPGFSQSLLLDLYQTNIRVNSEGKLVGEKYIENAQRYKQNTFENEIRRAELSISAVQAQAVEYYLTNLSSR